MTHPNPDILGTLEAAQELRMSRRTVLHHIRAGTIAATKLGPGTAQYVITRAEIERVKRERVA